MDQNNDQLIESKGTILGIGVTIFCLFYFLYYSSSFYYSAIAAVLAGFSAWFVYIILRVFILSAKR